MKILHIYKDYYPILGGIENHIKVLTEAQAAAGHHVTALVCNPASRTITENLKGVEVIKAGRIATIASMPISFSQPYLAARQHPDIVHVHSPYPLGELTAWLLKSRVPLVITHHSDVIRQRGLLQIYGPFLHQVLRHADRILATSPRYIETSPWLTPLKAKCTVVPLGVDEKRFCPPATPFNGPPTLLVVGRLRYYKGIDTLLHALTDLSGVHLNIVGIGPMEAEWRALTKTLALQERVHFLGEVDDAHLPSQYHQAHLFVLPANARSEAFGTVLLEAMASGLPCVSTELGTGTSWVVQDGVTGHVVPPSDPQALANAVHNLLDNPQKLQTMGQAARDRVEREFTQARMIQRVMTVYESLT